MAEFIEARARPIQAATFAKDAVGAARPAFVDSYPVAGVQELFNQVRQTHPNDLAQVEGSLNFLHYHAGAFMFALERALEEKRLISTFLEGSSPVKYKHPDASLRLPEGYNAQIRASRVGVVAVGLAVERVVNGRRQTGRLLEDRAIQVVVHDAQNRVNHVLERTTSTVEDIIPLAPDLPPPPITTRTIAYYQQPHTGRADEPYETLYHETIYSRMRAQQGGSYMVGSPRLELGHGQTAQNQNEWDSEHAADTAGRYLQMATHLGQVADVLNG